MDRYGCMLKITNGRGNDERQVVTIGKNFDIGDVSGGKEGRERVKQLMLDYARSLGLGPLLDDLDVRITMDTYAGGNVW